MGIQCALQCKCVFFIEIVEKYQNSAQRMFSENYLLVDTNPVDTLTRSGGSRPSFWWGRVDVQCRVSSFH